MSIADELSVRFSDVEILFVGAKGKMEMEKIPKAGYRIKGLWISGFQRSLSLSNLLFPLKVISSSLEARKIVREFKPHIAIGTGGYASGPVVNAAAKLGIPTLIQEQNSYAGVTNRILGRKANKICVAYDNMDKYFNPKNIVLTGNPIRLSLLADHTSVEDARSFFGLSPDVPTVLVVGGSLGSRTFNNCMADAYDLLKKAPYQIIWQIGSGNYHAYKDCDVAQLPNVKALPFLEDMAKAYKAADIVVSRAGGAISELSALGKPTILVPSPIVAEDHQTKNAVALVQKRAAIMITDKNAPKELFEIVGELIRDKEQLLQLSQNIKRLAKPDATKRIVDEIENLVD